MYIVQNVTGNVGFRFVKTLAVKDSCTKYDNKLGLETCVTNKTTCTVGKSVGTLAQKTALLINIFSLNSLLLGTIPFSHRKVFFTFCKCTKCVWVVFQ